MHNSLFLLSLLLTAATAATAQSPATGQILGHDYVDLGLSVMWATCNIGASSPSDYGDYFAWGEAETKTAYTKENCATCGKSTYTFLDAASIHWGSAWRMPTKEDINELISKCKWIPANIDGHKGFLGFGPNGNSIFLPSAGDRDGTSLENTEKLSRYWSSSLWGKDSEYACSIKHSDDEHKTIGYSRFAGLPIRPVSSTSEQENNKRPTSGQISGHDYVDLGLSVKWATCNVGANSPSDYGHYFAWGESKTKSSYTEDNSDTYKKKKYTFQDAATINWGMNWRMPTEAEFQELLSNCTWTWITQDGHKGCKVTSKKNGNSIFLPAAGRMCDLLPSTAGTWGLYWSSSPNESHNKQAYDIFIIDGFGQGVGYSDRCDGLPIRPVTE